MRGAAVAIVAAAALTAAGAYGYWAVRSTTVRDHPVAPATPTRKAPHLARPSFDRTTSQAGDEAGVDRVPPFRLRHGSLLK